jgi:predicted transposase YdaD
MSELQNPHDRFFRETFSRLEVARDFLTEYLPSEVVAVLNLDTLELQ